MYIPEFSVSLLQASVSHDPSEIMIICWFDAQETFIIIINVETSYLCKNYDTFDSLMIGKVKRTAFTLL